MVNPLNPVTRPGPGQKIFLPLFLISLLLPLSPAHADSALPPILASNLTAIHAAPPDAAAANDLASYLHKITAANYTVTLSNKPPTQNTWLIGPLGSTEANSLPGDSFIIKTDPSQNTIHIFGATPRATRQAVFHFLETQAHCRWYSHTEEDVPQNPNLTIQPLNQTTIAPFWQTDLRNNEAQSDLNAFNYKIKSISTDIQTRSHAMHAQLAPYGTTHPEIYPLDKKTGKRAPNKVHHCYTAPGLPQALADAIELDIKKWPDIQHTIYMSCMGDAYGGYCQCSTCTPIYEAEAFTRPDGTKSPAYSATLLQLINQTAQILEAKHPGIRVGTSAYMTLQAPPAITKPRHNVYIRIPHLRHCIIHAVDACPKNKRYHQDLQEWLRLAPNRVYIWDYTVNFGENFLFPTPTTKSIAANIKLYAKLKASGMTLQGNYVSTGSDLAVLKNHVYSKLLWNPDLDTDTLIADFCKNYYGPAADPMLKYINLLEDHPTQTQNLKLHADEFAEISDIRATYLPPELIKELQTAMDQATAASRGTPPFDRRVAEAAVSLTAWALAPEKTFIQTPQGLAKNFAGKPVYTYDRAVDMLKNSRNASFREWAGPLKYHANFLSQQGGPLFPITTPDKKTTALLAPALGLSIHQINYKNTPLLHTPASIDEPGFPLASGCFESTSPGVVHGTLLTPTSTSSTSSTHDAGRRMLDNSISASGFHTSNTTDMASVIKTLTATPQNTLKITLSSQTTKRKPNFQSAAGTANLTFDLNRKSLPTLLIDDGSGAGLKPFPFPKPPPYNSKAKPKKNPPPIEHSLGPKILAIKIILPDKNCAILDRIDTTPDKAGPATLSFDTQSHTFKTSLTIPRTPINDSTQTLWLTRTLQVTDQ